MFGSSDWFLQCPRRCHLALLSWDIVSFAACSLAEEKTCKINTAGELPRAADWQPTLSSVPLPRYLLAEFAGSCCALADLGGGFLLADAYKKRSGAWVCAKGGAGQVSCCVAVTSRSSPEQRDSFVHLKPIESFWTLESHSWMFLGFQQSLENRGFWFSSVPKAVLCVGDTKCFQPWPSERRPRILVRTAL